MAKAASVKKQVQTANVSQKPAVNSNQLRETIEKKAYELYVQRGKITGNELSDWLKAEQLVKQHSSLS